MLEAAFKNTSWARYCNNAGLDGRLDILGDLNALIGVNSPHVDNTVRQGNFETDEPFQRRQFNL